MRTKEERRFVLPRKVGDRVLAFVLGCVLTGFFALMHVQLERRAVPGNLGGILHAIAVETMFVFSLFSALALLWAAFTPRWLEALLTRTLSKVLTTIVIVLVATVCTVLYYVL
jgi:hypothetical protein